VPLVVEARLLRRVRWVGSSRRDLRALPKKVRQKIGFALYFAQHGQTHESAKPLRGFGGAGVLEVVDDCDRRTYRAVYTVRFSAAVYVLHVFQKKAKRGIATPQRDLDLVRGRLQEAARLDAEQKAT
jgi:phage-related protein